MDHRRFCRGGCFFVISGFLISTLIFGNLDTGSFTFAEFYARRIKRIFPALLLVLSACYVLGWFALLGYEFEQLGKHIAGGAGFVANFVLWGESGYFDHTSDTKPLLHLWSLGIEEQFYILFPPLVFLFAKYRLKFWPLLLFLFVTSFGLNIALAPSHNVADFYSPGTRFWELMIGSLLAWVMLYRKEFVAAAILNHALRRHCLSLLGLGFIAAALWMITRTTLFPGWWALLPTLGAALIIVAGPQAWPNRTFLSHPLVVWFGLISFPLYLWHWPLLAFAHIGAGARPPVEIRILAILFSLLLAWLTYRFLERPIRGSKNHKPYVLSLCLLMGLIAGAGLWTQHRLHRMPLRQIDVLSIQANDMHAMEKKILEQDDSCQRLLNIDPTNMICKAKSAAPDIMVLGDSTASSFNYAALTGRVPVDTLLISRPGCLPFVDFVNYGAGETLKEKTFCNRMTQGAIQDLDRLASIHTVVLVSSGSLFIRGGFGSKQNEQDWSKYKITKADGHYVGSRKEAFVDGYSGTIQRLLETGRHVILVKEMPELEVSTVDCLAARSGLAFLPKNPADCRTARPKLADWQSEYDSAIAEIAQKNPGLLIYDPFSLVCDAQFCYGAREGRVYYYDSHHLGLEGSELVWRDFLPWLAARGIVLKKEP